MAFKANHRSSRTQIEMIESCRREFSMLEPWEVGYVSEFYARMDQVDDLA